QPVMQPNGLVDLLMDLLPAMYIVRRKPAAHAFVLQVGMNPLGKLLVVRRVADEAGVELDGTSYHRADVGDELLGNAAAAQEDLGDLAARFVNRVNADAGRADMVDRIEPLGFAQVNITKDCCTQGCHAEIRVTEVRTTEVCPTKVRQLEMYPSEIRLAEIRPDEARSVEIRPVQLCIHK